MSTKYRFIEIVIASLLFGCFPALAGDQRQISADRLDSSDTPAADPRKELQPSSVTDTKKLPRDLYNWWNSCREVMEEPDYDLSNAPEFMIRYFHIRAMLNPTSVIIVKSSTTSKVLLEFREVNIKNRTGPDKFVVNKQRTCSKNEFDKAKEILSKSNYWNLPASGPPTNIDDDTCWFIEVWDHGRHHTVQRYQGAPDSLSAISSFLFDLTDKQIPTRPKKR